MWTSCHEEEEDAKRFRLAQHFFTVIAAATAICLENFQCFQNKFSKRKFSSFDSEIRSKAFQASLAKLFKLS